ncbi:MAG: glycosyltransferase family 2 protein [Bacteroidales bacterium]
MKNRKNLPKVTVVTVSYNSRDTIEQTIQSVIGQDYKPVEYIIIDGGSRDGTIQIIEKYSGQISTFISEPDKGIYDGMNKGIEMASGEWIIFMNSNDTFHNNAVISGFISRAGDADIVYGYCTNASNGKDIKPKPLHKFWKRIPMNHQSTFVKTGLHKTYKFDLRYKVSAVYDFFYHCYTRNCKFTYIDEPVAVYDLSGVSSHSYWWLWDYFRIAMKYAGNKKVRVIFRLFYMTAVMIYINVFLKKKRKRRIYSS